MANATGLHPHALLSPFMQQSQDAGANQQVRQQGPLTAFRRCATGSHGNTVLNSCRHSTTHGGAQRRHQGCTMAGTLPIAMLPTIPATRQARHGSSLLRPCRCQGLQSVLAETAAFLLCHWLDCFASLPATHLHGLQVMQAVLPL